MVAHILPSHRTVNRRGQHPESANCTAGAGEWGGTFDGRSCTGLRCHKTGDSVVIVLGALRTGDVDLHAFFRPWTRCLYRPRLIGGVGACEHES